ncbi:MAG TPA: SGNH/GDSL hydrolase family protein [Candidatus Paceibacterota bacterium]
MKNFFLKLLLLGATFTVIFAVLEMGIRLWDPNESIRLYQDDVQVGRIYKPNMDIMARGDHGTRGHLITNSYGFIGEEVTKEKPEGVLRVAHMGDSFTAGLAVDYEKKYATLIGEELSEKLGKKVETLNFGIPSQGTHEQYLHYIHRAADFDPDAVVLYFFLGNDFDENLESLEELTAKFAAQSGGSGLRKLARKSELVLFVLNRLVQVPAANTLMYHLGIIRERDDSVAIQPATTTVPLPRRLTLITTAADEVLNAKALSNTGDYLRLFKEAVGDKKFLIVLIPRHPQVEKRLEEAEIAQFPELRDLGFDPLRRNRELGKILEDLGIDFIDITPDIRTALAEGKKIYICDDCHLGVEGHELVSTIVSKHLFEYFSSLPQ